MVCLVHVEPFSSKISELKPWGPLKPSISGILELIFFLEKTIGLNFNILELYVLKGNLNVSKKVSAARGSEILHFNNVEATRCLSTFCEKVCVCVCVFSTGVRILSVRNFAHN